MVYGTGAHINGAPQGGLVHLDYHEWIAVSLIMVRPQPLNPFMVPQCPLNAIWPFKLYLSQNSPAIRNPKLKMKTSLQYNLLATTTNKHRALSLQEVELDG